MDDEKDIDLEDQEDEIENEEDDDYESEPEYYEDSSSEEPDPFLHGYHQGNRFIQNLGSRESSISQGTTANDNIGNHNYNLKNNINKQAKEKPEKSNNMKSSNSTSSSGTDMGKQMAMNKAQNTMSSIHNNNKNGNSDEKNDISENTEEKKSGKVPSLEEIRQMGKEMGKETLSQAITAETGIPKPIADKLVDMAVNKQEKKQKFQLYAICTVVILFVFLMISIVFGDDNGDSETKTSSLKAYYSGSMSEEDLFDYFADTGVVDTNLCTDSDGSFDNTCPFMSFINKIRDNTDNESQFLKTFYAVSHNRLLGNITQYDNIDEELNALFEHKDSLSTYLNGDYKSTYRSDIDEDFDLYSYVKSMTESGQQNYTNYSICEKIIVNGEDEPVPFEEYVAGVVKQEMGHASSEATKALAIAARTYAYVATDGCSLPISNSTSQQTYSKINIEDSNDSRIMDLVDDVKGIVLQNSYGEIFSTQYDSFCFTNKDDDKKIYHFDQGNVDIPFSWVEQKNVLGMGTAPYHMKSGQTVTSGWIRLNCPCNKSGAKVSEESPYYYTCTTVEGNYMDGGHGNGMSQYGAMYLDEVEELNYQEILKRFYGEDIVFAKLSSEFETDSDTGFVMRVKRAQRNNEFYYSSSNLEYSANLEGECVWYAEGRADEILSNWGVNKSYTALGDGGQFCDSAERYNYKVNERVNEIEQGSIISWKYGKFGHVAIVEKVNRNDSGDVVSIVISQGGLGYYNMDGKTSFVYRGNTILTSDFSGNNWGFVNDDSYGGTRYERRKAWCEAFDTGCQYFGEILYGDKITTYGHQGASWCTIPLSQFR